MRGLKVQSGDILQPTPRVCKRGYLNRPNTTGRAPGDKHVNQDHQDQDRQGPPSPTGPSRPVQGSLHSNHTH